MTPEMNVGRKTKGTELEFLVYISLSFITLVGIFNSFRDSDALWLERLNRESERKSINNKIAS